MRCHIDKDELKHYFIEMNRFGEVKFRNCNIKEPKCHVKQQLENGCLAQFRYDHYIQLYNEISNRKVDINEENLPITIFKFENEIKALEEAQIDGLHFDVMDGQFVPNISIGIPILDSVRAATQYRLMFT